MSGFIRTMNPSTGGFGTAPELNAMLFCPDFTSIGPYLKLYLVAPATGASSVLAAAVVVVVVAGVVAVEVVTSILVEGSVVGADEPGSSVLANAAVVGEEFGADVVVAPDEHAASIAINPTPRINRVRLDIQEGYARQGRLSLRIPCEC
jgi:hypothetical protein